MSSKFTSPWCSRVLARPARCKQSTRPCCGRHRGWTGCDIYLSRSSGSCNACSWTSHLRSGSSQHRATGEGSWKNSGIYKVKVTYSEAREKPAQATEDESLDEADDVEQLPAFHVDAVDGEEDGNGAVDCHGQCKHKEPSAIPWQIYQLNSRWKSSCFFSSVHFCYLRPTQL